MIREREYKGIPGLPMLLILIVAGLACVYGVIEGARTSAPALVIPSALGLMLVVFLMAGLFVVNPGRPQWSATFWSCFAESGRRSRSSTQGRSTNRAPWLIVSRFSFGSIGNYWRLCSAGPMTICGA
jgi:hypothetical protein